MFKSMTLAAESSSDRRAEDEGSLVRSYCQQSIGQADRGIHIQMYVHMGKHMCALPYMHIYL